MVEPAGDGFHAVAGGLGRHRGGQNNGDHNSKVKHNLAIMKDPNTTAAPGGLWTRHLLFLLLAWLLAAAWGSVAQTQWNLQALTGVGVPIPWVDRLRVTGLDLVFFAPVYGGILAAGWLPALAVAALLARWWPRGRTALFALAAGVGMVAAVRAVDAVAPMPVFIDATRHLPGLLSMAAGAVLAGLLYARRTARATRA